MRDLVMGESVNEFNPRLVLVRYGQIKTSTRLVISYQKKKYDSHDQIKSDSVMKGFKLEEFEKERDNRRQKFDQRFESIFGLN
jgi:hypothetical protein